MTTRTIKIEMGRNYPAEQGTMQTCALLGWIFDGEYDIVSFPLPRVTLLHLPAHSAWQADSANVTASASVTFYCGCTIAFCEFLERKVSPDRLPSLLTVCKNL